jgi:hypothetical protein
MEKTPVKICFNTSRDEIKLEEFLAPINMASLINLQKKVD